MKPEVLNILLIEDSLGDVDLLKHVLGDVPGLAYDLTHLDRLAPLADTARAARFDVLLLDLSLPDSYGLETIDRAIEAAPDLPIIVLTGTNDEELGVQALTRGAQDYIVKGDYDGWQLLRALRYAIERKKSRIELRRAYEDIEGRILRDLGLLAALQWLGKSMKDACGLVVHVAGDAACGDIVADEAGVCAALFQAVRELLATLVAAAGVTSVRFELTRPDPGHVRLTVSDFDSAAAPLSAGADDDATTGLPAIRRRLETLGGQLDIASAPGRRITLTVPLPPPGALPA